MKLLLEISDVFEQLSIYESKRERDFPSTVFHKYSKQLKISIGFRTHDSGRIAIMFPDSNEVVLGESSSYIFKEYLDTHDCKRLSDYKKHYGPIEFTSSTESDRISYELANNIADYFIQKATKHLNRVPYLITKVGSLRRQKSTIGDIDLMITHFKESDREILLKVFSLCYDKLNMSGSIKLSGIFNDFQIDVKFIETRSYACQLLRSTGPKEFNIACSKRANSLGYKLNDYCLTELTGGNEIYPETEEDIFKLLKIKYLPPVHRDYSITTYN